MVIQFLPQGPQASGAQGAIPSLVCYQCVVADFRHIANLLCLDFVNTEVMAAGERADLLADFAALARWARETGIVSEGEERGAVRSWGRGQAGAKALDAARRLRAALRALAEDLSEGKAPATASVAAVNAVLAMGASVLQIARRDGAFATTRQLVSPDAASLLVPVAESAAWLLEHGDAALVHRCENPSCILFFYDTTKNKRRRWCAMDACGSRAKAAAYYRRTRGIEGRAPARRGAGAQK
jgi:predicted RNA-binding Zn ribbon-like protein